MLVPLHNAFLCVHNHLLASKRGKVRVKRAHEFGANATLPIALKDTNTLSFHSFVGKRSTACSTDSFGACSVTCNYVHSGGNLIKAVDLDGFINTLFLTKNTAPHALRFLCGSSALDLHLHCLFLCTRRKRMALVEAQQGDDFSSSSWLPNRFPGERFLARIARVEFSLTSVPSAHRDRINETGEALLSDIRVLLVAWHPSSSLTKAIDLPLLYVVHEKLEMPVLGANAISGQCYPVAPNGGPDGELPPYSFRVAFKSGGCSAFLELFQRMLQRARANDQDGAREETAEQQQQHDTGAQRPEEDNLLPAYIDPNDSTDVHLAQPPEDNTMPQAYPAGSATMQLYKRR